MKFLKTITLFFLFGISIIANAQKDSAFTLIKKIPGTYKAFEVDNLGNIYLFNASGQLKKLNSNYDSSGVFNDIKRFGVPSNIDVSNPLKILLYYKKYSTIVVLDRFLSLRNTINLRKKGFFKVNAVATSYDNHIWVFDEQDFKLKKVDDEITTLNETPDLRLVLDSVPSPQKIINRENAVFVYDTAKGFYIFDNYGAYKNHLPFYRWNNVDANENRIYGFNKNNLLSYQLQSLKLNEYTLPVNIINSLAVKAIHGKLYLLSKSGLEIYNLK